MRAAMRTDHLENMFTKRTHFSSQPEHGKPLTPIDHEPANPGVTPSFRRTLPETGCLLGWAFGPRSFMKNCPSGDGALRGLTRLPWISGAFCRKSAGSPVCPRFPGPGPRTGFSTLSQGLPHGIRCTNPDAIL